MQNLSLKEKAVKMDTKSDKIVIKEEQRCDSEQEALEATQGAAPGDNTRRWADDSFCCGVCM